MARVAIIGAGVGGGVRFRALTGALMMLGGPCFTRARPSNRMPLLLRVFRDGAPGFVAVTGGEEK